MQNRSMYSNTSHRLRHPAVKMAAALLGLFLQAILRGGLCMNLITAEARKTGAAPRVLETIALIEQLGGRAVDRSQHAGTAQLWIYNFPGLRNVRANLFSPSRVMRPRR